MVTCWNIWRWKNISILKEDFHRPTNPIHLILEMVRAIEMGEHPHLAGESRHLDTIYIGWKKPHEDYVKLNSNGAYKEPLDLAGCGGLFRDAISQWITGYARKIGTCDASHAEMWDMYEGLKIARRQGFLQLIVESDSKLLVDMVTGNYKLSGATPILIHRLCDLIDLPWNVHINHT